MTRHEREALKCIEDMATRHDEEAEYFSHLAKKWSDSIVMRKTYQRMSSNERCLARAIRALVKT